MCFDQQIIKGDVAREILPLQVRLLGHEGGLAFPTLCAEAADRLQLSSCLPLVQ